MTIHMDCVYSRCGAEFSRKDNLARHLRRKNLCMPIYTTALEMETTEISGQYGALETCIEKLAENIEVLSQRIHEMSFGNKDEEDEDQCGGEEESLGDEDESEDKEENEDVDEHETIPAPTKNRAMAMCTKHIAKHAEDLHELADAGPRKRRQILANAPPTLHRALGDVAQLVLDRKIGIPA